MGSMPLSYGISLTAEFRFGPMSAPTTSMPTARADETPTKSRIGNRPSSITAWRHGICVKISDFVNSITNPAQKKTRPPGPSYWIDRIPQKTVGQPVALRGCTEFPCILLRIEYVKELIARGQLRDEAITQ